MQSGQAHTAAGDFSAGSVLLRVEADTPRLRYAVRVLLQDLLGLHVQVLTAQERPPLAQAENAPAAAPCYRLDYTRQPLPGWTPLPCCGLLYETGLRELEPWNLLAPKPGEPEAQAFDPLARAFVRLTAWACWSGQAERDQHGRCRPHPLLHDPLEARDGAEVPRLALQVAELLGLAPPPCLQAGGRTLLTVDLDQPWLVRRKPAWVQLGALAQTLLGQNRDLSPARRLRVLLGLAPDPNQHFFAWLQKQAPPAALQLFALPGTDHPFDSRFTPGHRAWEGLLRELHQAGWAIGLHPSYRCVEQPQRLARELDWLQQVLGQPVDSVRMHYLRLREPHTRRQFLALGLQHDYTSCWAEQPGFQYGMDRPFPWYDLEREHPTRLMLHPTTLMDRTLLSHLGLGPQQAGLVLLKWRQLALKQGGEFTPLVHNELWSEAGPWRGWRSLERIIGSMLAENPEQAQAER